MSQLDVRVAEVIEESAVDRTYVIEVQGDDAAAFTWTPGQYTTLLDPAAAEPKQRYYTISSAPRGDARFEVTIRAGSPEDIAQFGYEAGQSLVATPPDGTFLLEYDEGDAIVFFAGGSGITPFRSFLQGLRQLDAKPAVTLVQSDRVPSRLLFRDEFSGYAAEGWLRYAPRVDDGQAEPWDGATGFVTDEVVASNVDDAERTIVFACGPTAFVEIVLEAAKKAGVPEDRCRKEGWG